jgi:hypothetical protein
MNKIIHTPASLAEADRRLTDIERVLMARGWERAAILATVVRLPGSGRKAESGFCSPNEYADRRIPGLLKHEVIRTYVQRWLDANGGTYPDADTDIELPSTPWPPIDKGDAGSRATPSNIGRQMAANPELAQAAAEALAEGAIERVSGAVVRELSNAIDDKVLHDTGAAANPDRFTDRGMSSEEQQEAAYWHKVDKALHLLLDAKVRIANGATPPPRIAILMELLAPEQDWDEALRQEIGGLR